MIVGGVVFLLNLVSLVMQYLRPKVFARIETSRWGATYMSWSNLSENLTFVGKGPGLDVKSKDDIGVGVLNGLQDEQIVERYQGKRKKGQSQSLTLTNRRVNFRRSSVCCGGKILRADSLSSYKLEEVASTTS